MLTYDDLNAMINDLSEENRRYEILESENEIDSEVDFLETENESQAIAENAAEERERAETPRIYPDNYIGTTAEIRYYGKDTENTAYAYVKGELNDQAFQEIAARGSGADTFVIAADSVAFDAQSMQSRSMIYLEIGKEIGE